MADQDDRTFRVPDRPLGGGNVVLQRVERVLDCNDLESGLFEIRNDFLPARPVRKRTMDKDCGLGFQLVSRNWQADRGHRGQEEAQAHNAFVRFHSYVPSFGGDLGVAVVVISTKQSNATNEKVLFTTWSSEVSRTRSGTIDRDLARRPRGLSHPLRCGPVIREPNREMRRV